MKKIVFTDLDRTLFTQDSQISQRNYDSLVKLGQAGIIRVIVTGRNLYSAQSVLPSDFPIDYLVISSGAGIIDFKTQKLITKNEIDNKLVRRVILFLQELDVDFMIHHPIPQNHFFHYYKATNPCRDSAKRINHYQGFAYEIKGEYDQNASQLLAIVEEDKEDLVEHVIENLPDLSIIRATSPLDHKSVWIEIFPKGINKGYACNKLLSDLGLATSQALAIGNDYNDIAMLESFTDSYVVGNAPQIMKDIYKLVARDRDDGFTEMLSKHFNFIK
jgi:Cof subfamily protein (haloacid dehalogenase superfamily)